MFMAGLKCLEIILFRNGYYVPSVKKKNFRELPFDHHFKGSIFKSVLDNVHIVIFFQYEILLLLNKIKVGFEEWKRWCQNHPSVTSPGFLTCKHGGWARSLKPHKEHGIYKKPIKWLNIIPAWLNYFKREWKLCLRDLKNITRILWPKMKYEVLTAVKGVE